MALSYAARLTKGVPYGKCGLPEHHDPPGLQSQRVAQLAALIRQSKHLVVYTGAGISTAAGIPDFRGPKGVWTKEMKERSRKRRRKQLAKRALAAGVLPEPEPDDEVELLEGARDAANELDSNVEVSVEKKEAEGKEDAEREEKDVRFEDARPSLTHMALVALRQAGILKHLVSQNVDGLHVRSHFPVAQLSELHGNVFLELCSECGKRFYRSFEIQSIGFRPTGRRCDCGGVLVDSLLDWNDALPEDDMRRARLETAKADLVLVLGSSLRVEPANGFPVAVTRNGGKLVIVNLQETPKDRYAHLRLFAPCDIVMQRVMEALALPVPVWPGPPLAPEELGAEEQPPPTQRTQQGRAPMRPQPAQPTIPREAELEVVVQVSCSVPSMNLS